MKTWILRPVANLSEDNDPWAPWYDKAFGFVVVAETEKDARIAADLNAGDENRGEFYTGKTWEKNPWLNPHLSTCRELRADDYTGPTIIIRDFASA